MADSNFRVLGMERMARPQGLIVTTKTEIQLPPLAEGERYAGIILDDDGQPSHHLILLTGDEGDLNHEGALAWAKGVGGDLPTRHEQSLLFANLRTFQQAAYWSAETYAKDPSCAWFQNFVYGNQYFSYESLQLRAVAVRRIQIVQGESDANGDR